MIKGVVTSKTFGFTKEKSIDYRIPNGSREKKKMIFKFRDHEGFGPGSSDLKHSYIHIKTTHNKCAGSFTAHGAVLRTEQRNPE